jgi:outer membrane lipoprotein carrier protein
MRALMIFAALLTPASGAESQSEQAQEIARRIQKHHESLVTLQARFTQIYRSGALGREIVERGQVQIKPPRRMRWEYRDPEKKLFVCDGAHVYFYVPADRQVVVRAQNAQLGLAFELLSGRATLLDEFSVALDQIRAGRRRLRLQPRQTDPNVMYVILDVDSSGRILAIEILDAQGNSNLLRFEAIRENDRLSDRIFEFKIPDDVEVVQG